MEARNKHTAQFMPLQPDDTALLPDTIKGKWTKEVMIAAVNPSRKLYEVQDSQGRTNSGRRELLRKRIKSPCSNSPIFARHPKDTDKKY